MARPRLEAHLVVVSATAAKYASARNLLGIDFYHAIPADTEFPTHLGTLDVFVRFFNWGCHPVTLAVELWWLTEEAQDRVLVRRMTKEVDFKPAVPIFDHTFRLSNVTAPGEGLYAARVCRLTRSRSCELYWKKLRDDYFRVVRHS